MQVILLPKNPLPKKLSEKIARFSTQKIDPTTGVTVSAIIIGEMEMWRCHDYLFTVAESRGGII